MASGVLVLAEVTEEGKLAPGVPELLGPPARLGGPVTCALLGAGVEALAKECVAFGADKVIVVDDPLLAEYQGDAYAPVAERICKELDPAIALMGQTMLGRDLAPRLAARLGPAAAKGCGGVGVPGGN